MVGCEGVWAGNEGAKSSFYPLLPPFSPLCTFLKARITQLAQVQNKSQLFLYSISHITPTALPNCVILALRKVHKGGKGGKRG